MSEPPFLRAENLMRTFGTGATAVHALRGVTLGLERARLTAFRGRSGSGKTTLLNLLGGLDRPTAGRVVFEGVELSALVEPALTGLRRRRIGYVFQSFALLPLLTARENVEFPLRLTGVSFRERRQRAERWLEYVGLKDRMHHRPFELSGGEQQRVAIARALVTEPELVLADEPTGQLDSATAWQVLELLKRVVRETGMAVCLTTHDPAIIDTADVVYTLTDGALAEDVTI